MLMDRLTDEVRLEAQWTKMFTDDMLRVGSRWMENLVRWRSALEKAVCVIGRPYRAMEK